MTSIVLFSNDLRLDDNLALSNACKKGEIIPVFILDENLVRNQGQASKVWLYYALSNLNKSLNNKLILLKGSLENKLLNLAKELNISEIYFNKNFEPSQIKAFDKLKKSCIENNINFYEYNSHLLFNPKELLKSDLSYYKVFTPFYINAMKKDSLIRIPESGINIKIKKNTYKKSLNINDLKLLPKLDWYKRVCSNWDMSESGAKILLDSFITEKLQNYKKNRDYIFKDGTSKLSPYLHFGQISVTRCYHEVLKVDCDKENKESFVRELMFREFSYYLLYFFDNFPHKNFNQKFDSFEWKGSANQLKKWQEGKTGIPIIDAGMRELYQTGFMHNRVRMLVGSFLVKNLLIDWREGKKWFEDTLFDCDLAANSFSWQWVAGSGVDAAPFFRIFNPITQSQKFDPKGEYIKKYVPELKEVPIKYIHEPYFMANFDNLQYPYPMVDLKETRVIALNNYQKMNKK